MVDNLLLYATAPLCAFNSSPNNAYHLATMGESSVFFFSNSTFIQHSSPQDALRRWTKPSMDKRNETGAGPAHGSRVYFGYNLGWSVMAYASGRIQQPQTRPTYLDQVCSEFGAELGGCFSSGWWGLSVRMTRDGLSPYKFSPRHIHACVFPRGKSSYLACSFFYKLMRPIITN